MGATKLFYNQGRVSLIKLNIGKHWLKIIDKKDDQINSSR